MIILYYHLNICSTLVSFWELPALLTDTPSFTKAASAYLACWRQIQSSQSVWNSFHISCCLSSFQLTLNVLNLKQEYKHLPYQTWCGANLDQVSKADWDELLDCYLCGMSHAHLCYMALRLNVLWVIDSGSCY